MSRAKIGSVGSAILSKEEKCKTCEQKVTSKDKGIQCENARDGGTVSVKKLMRRHMQCLT